MPIHKPVAKNSQASPNHEAKTARSAIQQPSPSSIFASLPVHEVLHLQRVLGNRAASKLLADQAASSTASQQSRVTSQAGPALVQRVIKAKSGETYTKASELPPAAQASQPLVDLATGPEVTLTQSPGDLIKRAQGQAAPILTPHRHLVGERHDASRFEEVVAAWGWGTTRLEEGFQRSKTVKEPFTESAANPGRLQSDMFKGVVPLEDMNARTLSDLSMYRFLAGAMALVADQMIYEVGARNIKAQSKARYEKFRNDIEENRQELLMRLEGYEAACIEILKHDAAADDLPQAALRGMATAMNGKWAALKTQMKLVSSSPWNIIFADAGDRDVINKLTARKTAALDLQRQTDILAGFCLNILKAETADDPTKRLADKSWADATSSTGNPLTDIGPIREAFMAKNINAAAKPAIVRIGSQHVTNLAGQITDGKYHSDYTNFEADVQGP